MDTQRVLQSGALGVHLLFERDTITEAFDQDGPTLRGTVERDLESIQTAVESLLEQPDAEAGRLFIRALPRPVQHVLVLLYFELLDGLIRRQNPTLH